MGMSCTRLDGMAMLDGMEMLDDMEMLDGIETRDCMEILNRCDNHSSEQKLRDFRPPYLTKKKSMREYFHLSLFAQLSTNNPK